MQSIYEYTDYRTYLQDFLEHSRTHKRGFSPRQFSRKADIGSPNYITQVIEKKRNLGLKQTEKFIRGLD